MKLFILSMFAMIGISQAQAASFELTYSCVNAQKFEMKLFVGPSNTALLVFGNRAMTGKTDSNLTGFTSDDGKTQAAFTGSGPTRGTEVKFYNRTFKFTECRYIDNEAGGGSVSVHN